MDVALSRMDDRHTSDAERVASARGVISDCCGKSYHAG